MPSGRTHDRITWSCFPWVTLGALIISRNLGLGLVAGAGFLFGGLMFGPDLDVRSRQSQRWGWLGWIWRPYRGWLRHRSWLSHGPLAGTVGRLAYLGLWIFLVTLGAIEVTNWTGHTAITWGDLGQAMGNHLWAYRWVWLTLALGIEAGAMSHSLSDWLVSSWKQASRPPRSPRSVAKSTVKASRSRSRAKGSRSPKGKGSSGKKTPKIPKG